MFVARITTKAAHKLMPSHSVRRRRRARSSFTTAPKAYPAAMTPIPFEAADTATYARIRAALERKGANIGPLDQLIAAQAVARDLVLVTDNLREFRRVPGLRCENWMRSR